LKLTPVAMWSKAEVCSHLIAGLKFTLEQALKAQRGSRVIALLFL